MPIRLIIIDYITQYPLIAPGMISFVINRVNHIFLLFDRLILIYVYICSRLLREESFCRHPDNN